MHVHARPPLRLVPIRPSQTIRFRVMIAVLVLQVWAGVAVAADLPRALSSYEESPGVDLFTALRGRVATEPFNAIATAIFVLAILHTFLTAKFRHWAHVAEEQHEARRRDRVVAADVDNDGVADEVSFKGQILHFLGEVEAVFGIWAVALVIAATCYYDWPTAVNYIGHRVSFTEPMFVVVIMAIAGTRPVLQFAQRCMGAVASVGRNSTAAWWWAILTVAPILGSFITEPAAMTIAALLLARRFYSLNPPPRLAYATIGLLFVNVSVGGTLTHFAAPPVLMVAAPWKWDTAFMLTHIGWKAVLGIIAATSVYYFAFRQELRSLDAAPHVGPAPTGDQDAPIPAWITATQLGFMAFIVMVAHHPPLFIGAFLFFLAFAQATAHHQGRIGLRGPLLVGFFLAGLVVHGGLQAWWIEPVLTRLGEIPLFVGATVLTAFNDNAAITYLATLVPGFDDGLKYAVVAGAVCGGGLTVIANAPNPAGQNLLQRFFPEGVSPLYLAAYALVPTAIMAACFLFL